MTKVYLDYNATAPIRPEVIERVAEVMAAVGNPSSVHGAGQRARRAVEKARAQVAALVNAPPTAVTFTSGGTEANNQVLTKAGGPILTSAVEHPSVLAAENIQKIAVDGDGVLDLNALHAAILNEQPSLLSVMLANNETGVIQPIQAVADLAAEHGLRLHVDAVQAAGKIPIDFLGLGADFMTLSAHKLGGPQGVGALITRPDIEPPALLKGGAQEQRHRAGTENVAGIAGFGLACERAVSDTDFSTRVGVLRDMIEASVKKTTPECRVFGQAVARLPNTSCLTMPGIGHETQLIAFDLAGVAVSSGSACSSGKVGPSHVLAAMGVPDAEADSAIRVSFGWASTETDAENFLKVYNDLLKRRRAREGGENRPQAAARYA